MLTTTYSKLTVARSSALREFVIRPLRAAGSVALTLGLILFGANFLLTFVPPEHYRIRAVEAFEAGVPRPPRSPPLSSSRCACGCSKSQPASSRTQPASGLRSHPPAPMPPSSGLSPSRSGLLRHSRRGRAAESLNPVHQPCKPLDTSDATGAADTLALIKPPVPSGANPDQIRHRHEYDGLGTPSSRRSHCSAPPGSAP